MRDYIDEVKKTLDFLKRAEQDHQTERYAWLKTHTAPKARVLSIGCGEAKVEEYIFTNDIYQPIKNKEFWGIDMDMELINKAKERWPNGKFHQIDLASKFITFPFPDNYFVN